MNSVNNDMCDFKNGPLPPCAPLAVSYVPIQQEAKPQYKSSEALTRGTLFSRIGSAIFEHTEQNQPLCRNTAGRDDGALIHGRGA